MAWEQSPAARREQCSRQVHSCSPALLPLAPRRELAAASQCHQQEGAASEQNHHWDRTRWKCPSMHTHMGTHTHAQGWESRCTHTYWNCSRCHWCLMSRPLQSNQRDPLQQEHGQEARGHPGCHPALLAKGRTALASRKTCSPAPTGTSLCHMGKGGIFHPLLGPGDMQGKLPGEDGEARRACLAEVKALGFPGRGKVECTGRAMLAGMGAGAACTQRAGTGEPSCGDAQRRDNDRMGRSLGLCLLRLIPVLRPPHRGLLAAPAPARLCTAWGVWSLAGNSCPS